MVFVLRRFLVVAVTLASAPLMAQDLASRQLERVFEHAEFDDPVFLTHAGDGSGRIFVVGRRGTIQVLHPGQDRVSTFFDHRSQINSRPSEGGLLSVAFHPRYADNGRLYVYYTHGSFVSRVAEFLVSADPDAVDPASERVVFEVDQPAGNHNGGQLAFGPDGMLYVGLGDGGGRNDQYGHGQRPTTVLGAILRIDVDNLDEGLGYAVPADNPFVGNDQGWREEIWAWGLRNPWRFAFDRVTGQLWTGDVGQGEREEIDLVVRGGNYGWNIMEGNRCFNASTCDETGLIRPVIDYPRSDGVSVTGGYVYRGNALSQLYGAYVYGDFGSGRIWALRHDGTAVVDHARIARSDSPISSFGEDEGGELYVVGFDGRIWRFLPLDGEVPRPTSVAAAADDRAPSESTVDQNHPNPFNGTTTIGFAVGRAGPVRLTVLDALGRTVRVQDFGELAPGRYHAGWAGRDDAGRRVAAGVYFYRLTTVDGTAVRRMALVE